MPRVGLLGRTWSSLKRRFTTSAGPPRQRQAGSFAFIQELEDRRLLSVAFNGPEFRVNTFTAGPQQTFFQTPEAVAMNPATGDYVAVWSSQGQNSGPGWDVYFQRYNAAGQAQGSATLVNTHVQGANQEYAGVAMNASGNFVVTWSSNQLGHFNIYAQQYNSGGSAQGAAILVDTPANNDQTFSSVAMDASGNFAVSWLGQLSGPTWDVYAREFNSSGTATTGVFQVNGASSAPPGGGNQPGTSIAMDPSGGFVITWTGGQGNQQNVYAQLYAPGGTATGPTFQVNPNSTNPQGYSAVAMDAGGNFVITWSGQVQGPGNWDVYEQRYNSSGGVLGSAFQVNTSAGTNLYSAVAMDGSDNFVVTWSGQPPGGGNNLEVYGQQYFASGLPDGNQFLVNTYNAGNQEYPSVAMATNGHYVVVWSSNGQDGSNWGVYGQRFANAGILVTPGSSMATNHPGNTASYQVVLQSAPQQNVTIPINTSDPTQGTPSVSSLVFTTGNWNVPQTVTVTGQSNTPIPYFILNGPAVSNDPVFSGMTAPALYINAPQTPQIITSATSVQTTKSGGTATFNVALASAPVAPVTVTLTNSNASEGTLSQSTLTFDSTNWNEPQAVTVTGLNDHLVNGGVTYQITGAAASQDANYKNVGMSPVTVFNKDNVNAAGISVSTTSLQTTQSGSTATFSVVLTSQPLNGAHVSVNLGLTDASQGSLSQSTLNFEANHWNIPQTVTVTGLNDDMVHNNISYQITGVASSTDSLYNGLTITPITVVNQATDHAGFTVSQTQLQTTKNGGTAQFTVALNTIPSANVTLSLNTNGSSAGILSSTTLTFTPSDWNQPQTVTVTGVNDFMVTGNQNYQIKGTATSSDNTYNNQQLPNIQVVNQETNQAGFSVLPANLITTKNGGTATFAVALTSIPKNGQSVALKLTSSDTTEGTLAQPTVTLMFTAANWNVYQMVTVTGHNNPLALGNVAYEINGTASSGDGNYNNKTMTPVQMTNINPGSIAVSATSLTTTKTAGTATFNVSLTAPPLASVAVNLNNPDPGEGQLSASTLNFNLLNWSTPQTVTVTGLNDHVVEGNVTYQITGTASSQDLFYSNMIMPPVTVVNTGNLNTAGITVTAANPLITTQAGGSASFTVVLNSAPAGNVTINLGSSDAGEGQFPGSLNFDQGNWNTPQTVTVKGLNDGQGQAASYQITGVAASSDGSYNGTIITPVNVLNQASNVAGITVNHTSVQTQGEGGTATFNVALTTIPSAPVTINLTSSDPAHGLLSPATLTFDASDWNTGQTVTVIAQKTQAASGDIFWQVTGTATSSDANYNNQAMPTVSVDNRQNTQAGFVVTPGSDRLSTSQAGGQGTFTVALTSAPAASVNLALSVDNPNEGSLSQSSLKFTAANWNIPQVVVVTGQNDGNVYGAGGVNYNVLGVASSNDPNYSGLKLPNIQVNNQPTNVPAIAVSPILLNTTVAGGQATFSVALNSQPGQNPVTVSLTSLEPAEGSLSKSSLVFTNANWNVAQTVVVTGLNDGLYNGNQTYQIIGTASGGNGGNGTNFTGVTMPPVTVINQALAGIRVTPQNVTTTVAGGTGSFSVSLTAKPKGNVTITLVNPQPSEGALSQTTLRFNPSNWNTLQTVTVTGLNNQGAGGSQTYQITGSATSADSNYNGLGVTPVTVVNEEIGVATTTTLVSSSNPSVYGQTVTLTATVHATGTPTGTVTFVDGSTTLGTVALSGGIATFATSALAAATHSITADYNSAPLFVASTSATLSETVSPATLTVTAVNASKMYGQANPTFTDTITGFVNGDTASVLSGNASLTTTATAASGVGSYNITAAQGTLNAANYTFAFVNGTVTVTPATLTVTANNASKVYGQANPGFTDSITGFVNGDSSSVLSGAAGLSTTATTGSGVGSYGITATQGTLSADNYTFAFVNGTLTVTPATLTVTADNAGKVYGQSNPAFTDTITGFVNGDSPSVVSGAASLTTTATAGSGVGSYGITAAQGTLDTANYTFAFDNGTLTVSPAPLTITAVNTSKVQGLPNPTFTASYNGFVIGDTPASLSGTLTFSTTATTNSPVGTYPVTPSGLSSANYTITFVNGALTVTPGSASGSSTIVVSSGNPSAYGQAVTFSATVSPMGSANGTPTGTVSFLDGATLLGTATLDGGTAAFTTPALAAGNHNITVRYSGDASFAASTSPALTQTVTRAALTVTARDASKVYGHANPAFSVSYTGFVNGDGPGSLGGALRFSTPATAASPVGNYAIAPSGLTSSNYTITFASGTLTIAPATLTVTANDASSIYGGIIPAFTDKITGFVNGDNSRVVSGNANLSTTATTSSGIGAYTISVTQGTLSAANYTFAFVNGTLTLTRATLTVTANDASKAYGEANPAFSDTITGFVNGDTDAVVSGNPGLTTTANASSGVGTYTITVSRHDLNAANYTFAFANGALTVTPATLTVTANDASKVYGEANPAFSDTITGFVNGDPAGVVRGSASLTTTATAASGVGTYNIAAGPGDLSAPNYSFVFANGSLSVTPATLTITANNKSMSYGGSIPALDATFTGLVNGDTSAVVSGLSLSTTASSSSSLGTYPITVTGGAVANYTITDVNGTVTVTPAILTVTANNASKVYGQANPSFTATISGFVNGDTAAVVGGSPSLTTTANAGSGVGTYAILVSRHDLNAANYTFVFANGTLTVTPATLTVTANEASRVYGAANPAFTDTITGFINGDTASVVSGGASLTTTATALSGVGSYTITPAQGSLSAANYAFAFTNGTLRVTPAILTVTANNAFKALGQPNPAFSDTITGFVNGDTPGVISGSADLDTSATAASPVGAYAITAGPGTLNALNYTFALIDGTLTVSATPAVLTITADGATKIYGQANPVLTYTIAGFVNGDTASAVGGNASLATTATNASNVGTYTITAGPGTLSAAGYYTFAFANGTLTVTPATLTVTASDASKVSGQANPAFSDSISGFVNGDTVGVVNGNPSLTTTATAASGSGSYPIIVGPGSLSAANYNFAFAGGTLTVTPPPAPVTVASGHTTVFPASTVTSLFYAANNPASIVQASIRANGSSPTVSSPGSGATSTPTISANPQLLAILQANKIGQGESAPLSLPVSGHVGPAAQTVQAQAFMNPTPSTRVAKVMQTSSPQILDPARSDVTLASGEAYFGASNRASQEQVLAMVQQMHADFWREDVEELAPFERADDGEHEPGVLMATGIAATAGYVLFNTRAGMWLLSVLATRPLWKQFDPLEVLHSWDERAGTESLVDLVDD